MKKQFTIALLILGLFVLASIPAYADIMEGSRLIVGLIDQDPDPVEPGEFVDLKFTIQNEGKSPAKSAMIEILPEYPFILDHGEAAVRSLGDLKIYEPGSQDTGVVTVRYRLRVDSDALEGIYDIKLRYKAEDLNTWQELDPYNIRVKSTRGLLSIESIQTDPERVVPGQIITTSILLKNDGSNNLKDLQIVAKVTDVTEFSPVGTSNEQLIPLLSGNEEKNVMFKFIVSADAKLKSYKLPLTITFKDEDGNSYTKTNYITIIVDSIPEFTLNLEESEVYEPGMNGKIVVSLSNVGSSNINYATLKLKESEEYVVLSTDTVYLGNLESDDYETAEYTLYVPKYYASVPLAFELTYNDNYNNHYTKEVVLPMKMFTRIEARKYGLIEKNTGVIITIVLLFVAAGVGYWYWKNKKSKKQ